MPGTSHLFRGWFPYLKVSLEVIILRYWGLNYTLKSIIAFTFKTDYNWIVE